MLCRSSMEFVTQASIASACSPSGLTTRFAGKRGIDDEEENKESISKVGYQRHPVHRHPACAPRHLHDDHAVDSERTRRGGSSTAPAGYASSATGPARQDD